MYHSHRDRRVNGDESVPYPLLSYNDINPLVEGGIHLVGIIFLVLTKNAGVPLIHIAVYYNKLAYSPISSERLSKR
jgi:hypothetical protein